MSQGEGGGRPTKFIKEYIELAYNYTLLGADDRRLALYFEVGVSTIHNWKVKHKKFLNAIKRGKEIADIEVTKSLNQRARGYQTKKVVIKYKKVEQEDEFGQPKLDDKGQQLYKNVEISRDETLDNVAADPTSMIFWLKNRQPELWRDRKHINQELIVNVKKYEDMDKDELRDAIDKALA